MNKKYKYLIIVFLIVVSFVAYGRILGNEFITYDDDKYECRIWKPTLFHN